MAHGGYASRRTEERRPLGRRSKGLGVDYKKGKKKAKSVSIKNQIRSTERILLRKNLPPEVREAQEKKLAELKNHQELQYRLATERKIHLRDKKIKFFERRKIERMIRRLEKQQRTSSDHTLEEKNSDQLSKLREDLEYVRFFPKTEKYVSLFVGGDGPAVVHKRNKLREQIKANLLAAAANGKDLEETASDDDALDMSDDDFFLTGSSSDEAEADDELTDKSTREPASSASGRAASGMSSDEKDQRQLSARLLMPPPRALLSSRHRSVQNVEVSTSSNTSNNRTEHSSNARGSLNSRVDHSSNLSSNSDAHKPRRKRRPKKKKQVDVLNQPTMYHCPVCNTDGNETVEDAADHLVLCLEGLEENLPPSHDLQAVQAAKEGIQSAITAAGHAVDEGGELRVKIEDIEGLIEDADEIEDVDEAREEHAEVVQNAIDEATETRDDAIFLLEEAIDAAGVAVALANQLM